MTNFKISPEDIRVGNIVTGLRYANRISPLVRGEVISIHMLDDEYTYAVVDGTSAKENICMIPFESIRKVELSKSQKEILLNQMKEL